MTSDNSRDQAPCTRICRLAHNISECFAYTLKNAAGPYFYNICPEKSKF